MKKINIQVKHYVNNNDDFVTNLEIKSNEYKTNNELFNKNIMLEIENDRLFINKDCNDNIKTSEEFLESLVNNVIYTILYYCFIISLY